MIIVSACLLGENCKYSGGNNKSENVIKYLEDKEYILVCPEQLGGLSTPRNPSEIITYGNKDGNDVLVDVQKFYQIRYRCNKKLYTRCRRNFKNSKRT